HGALEGAQSCPGCTPETPLLVVTLSRDNRAPARNVALSVQKLSQIRHFSDNDRVPLVMHEHELATDAALVRRLVEAQFPEWSELRIERVASSGADNALYRLGAEMVVRLPRIEWAVAAVEKER